MNSDPAAERAVLAALYRGGHDSWVEVSDILSSDCFSCGNNSIYYRIMEKMLEDPGSKADVPSFMSTASVLGFPDLLKDQEEQKYLRALVK